MQTSWKQTALDAVPDPRQHMYLVGSFGLAMVVAGVTTPLSGGLLLALGFLYTYRRGEKAAKFDEAIEQHNLIAPSLRKEMLKDYVEEVGIDRAIAEIQWAESNNYPTTGCAIDLLESYQSKSPDEIEDSPTFTLTPPTSILNPPLPSPIPTATQSSTYTPKSQQPFDLLEAATEKIKHTFLIGISGGGKGYFAASVLRKIKERHDVSITLIDPKADPDESGYFEGVVDRLHRGVMDRMSLSEAVEFIRQGLEIFDEECDRWGKSKRCLLVLDEGSEIGKLLSTANDKEIKRKLSGILTGGDSRGRNLWVIGQNPFCDDLGLSLGPATQMRKIIILRSEDVAQTKAWKRAALMDGINTSDALPQIKLSDIKPTGRAIYWNDTDTWYPMPKLPNYSNYDRDNRSFLSPPLEEATSLPRQHLVDEVAPNTVQMPTSSAPRQLVNEVGDTDEALEIAILSFFNNATIKEPKAIRDIKSASSIRKLGDVEAQILTTLDRLIKREQLESPMKGFWALPDWHEGV